MFSKTILPAFAAFGATLVSAADICSESQISINSPADASQVASCSTIKGTVTIGTEAAGPVSIDGPKAITGDLILANNGGLTGLDSSSLVSIGGTFQIMNATGLNSINMPKLAKVQALEWQSLTKLETVTFSSGGLAEADEIRISDTFLPSLNAISVTSVKKIDINNNKRLDNWESNLETLSDEMVVNANGYGLSLSFPDLIWIANMTISNVSSISIPSLTAVNGSLRFYSNFFEEFAAPNLTKIMDGDISFTDNSALTNVSFPVLSQIGGGFLIANNTKLEAIDGFPELKTIGGAVKLRGNFTSVELPSLNDVKGAFDIASTDNIDSICDQFKKLAPSNQQGNGVIQGEFTCRSEDESANDVDSDGSGSSSGDDENVATSLSYSTPIIIAIVGLAQFLM